MNKEIEEAIKSMQERVDDLQRHILNYEKSDCKTGLYQSLIKEKEDIETVLNYIKDSTPNSAIREKIKEIKKYGKLAKECIENEVIIADSDSLNCGRAEAHNADAKLLEEILKEGEK